MQAFIGLLDSQERAVGCRSELTKTRQPFTWSVVTNTEEWSSPGTLMETQPMFGARGAWTLLSQCSVRVDD